MGAWLVSSAMRMRRLVLAAVVGLLALAVVQLGDSPVDVYPEFEPPAVQVQTEALGLSAEEVEQLITSPLEHDLLNGIPWLASIRSQSMPGLSAIDLTFEEGTDLYVARQMVQERMSQAAALPNVGTPPVMVQPTASTSRVAMVAMRSTEVSPIEMSVLARWQMRPRLMAIPGVAQVSIWGQRERQLQVQVDPERLRENDVTLTQLIETTGNALWVSPLSFVEASTPGTGGFIETPNQRIGIQHVSPITSSDQLADVAIEGVAGGNRRLGDVAEVLEDHQPLIGDASQQGERSLMLVVERFPDADVEQVTADVEDALAAMSAGLGGITLDTDVYRPAGYLDSALDRLALVAGIGLVLLILVVGLLTRSWRTALITLGSVATSLVAALFVLRLAGDPFTTMTLLGLAVVTALVVDDVVGDVAAMRARIREQAADKSTVAAVLSVAVRQRRSPLAYATVIALVALGPLVLLSDPAGEFVRPTLLAFTVAALASFLVALVVTPVLALMLLRPSDGKARDGDTWVERGYDRIAGRTSRRALPAVLGVAGLAVVLLALGIPALTNGSLLPQLQDHNVLVRMEGAAGTSLAEMDRVTGRAAAEIREIDGVSSVGTHVGRAIGADEVVDVDASEMWVTVAGDADYGDTLAAIRTAVRGYPGLRSEVRSYADDRISAVSDNTGDRLVVQVAGDDYGVLQQTAADVVEALKTVEGVILPEVEPLVTRPTVSVEVDLDAAERLDLRPGDVRREVSTLVSGLTVGSLYEEQAIFDVVIWGDPAIRSNVEALKSLLVYTPGGEPVRLGDVATVDITPSPQVIEREGVTRNLDVIAEVRGRSAADVAADATDRLRQMTFENEYRAEVLGDAVDRAGAARTVLFAVIAAAVLVFLLFQAGVSSWRGAVALFVTPLLAASGALAAGWLVGGAWSAGVLAAIASVALLAVRQSLVLVRRAQVLYADSVSEPAAALRASAREQAAPVLVTTLGTAAAFAPAAVLGGAGLEFLHPFAVALIAGLVTSTLVVLILLPALVAALGGLKPPPAVGPDTPDGRIPEQPAIPNQRSKDDRPESDLVGAAGGGAAMSIHRRYGIAFLSAAAALGLAGCQTSASGAVSAEEEAIAAAATVEEDPEGGPSKLTLTEDSALRLGVETAPVEGSAGALTIPYAAVVYDAEGDSWAFVQEEERVYRRAAIAIESVDGDTVRLTDGPPPGSEVVTVAAAELVGVEAGISGGE
jgi:Cu/Ag efflux pump CusA